MKLKNKVAVITGSARGIGRGIALRFAREGAVAVILDLDLVAAQQVAAEITAFGGKSRSFASDISHSEQLAATFAAIEEEFGCVDILVNNAGLAREESFLETSLESWQKSIGVMLTGTFLCSQLAAQMMVKNQWGRILNIASVSGLIGPPKMAAYSAAKGGVISLTRAMAVELADYGIRVNAICPGAILTELAMSVLNTEEIRKEKAKSLPCHHMGTIEDIAEAALYFCSPATDFVTGQILAVDGGATAIGYNSFSYSQSR